MALPIIVPILTSLVLTGLLQYLFRQNEQAVAPTIPLPPPYTPPFTGGQCADGQYRVYVNIQPVGQFPSQTFVTGIGKVQGLLRDIPAPNNGLVVGFLRADGTFEYKRVVIGADTPAQIAYVERLNGADNCGNLPNPNSGQPIGTGGAGLSPPPVLAPPPNSNDNRVTVLITGIIAALAAAAAAAATAAKASIAAAGAAASAAASAASAASTAAGAGTVLGGIASSLGGIANSLLGLLNGITEILKFLEELEKQVRKINTEEDKKEKEKRKRIIRYDFGKARGDGFLRLFPDDPDAAFDITYLDIQVVSIPLGFGKQFGNLSPYWYRYKELGHICFVTSTFGVLEVRKIEFARTSMVPPENSFGFFYFFGLDDAITANLSAFYTKTEEQA